MIWEDFLENLGLLGHRSRARDFPSGLVVKTFQHRGCGFDPWLGNQAVMCQVAQPSSKKEAERKTGM